MCGPGQCIARLRSCPGTLPHRPPARRSGASLHRPGCMASMPRGTGALSRSIAVELRETAVTSRSSEAKLLCITATPRSFVSSSRDAGAGSRGSGSMRLRTEATFRSLASSSREIAPELRDEGPALRSLAAIPRSIL